MKPIDKADIRSALQSVCESELFVPLERLRAFLTYIVEEELADRGDLILGKTIAEDVYHRSPTDAGDTVNVVRVDARRLRQTLDHYYDTAGREDKVRIFVDMGGYQPRFEYQVTNLGPLKKPRNRIAVIAVATFLFGAVLGATLSGLVWQWKSTETSASLDYGTSQSRLEREAIGDKSLASLQAVNLAAQARDMIFPIFDRPRQELVTEVFKRVIELDPQYFGGHAGAAQTLATLAILTPPGDKKDGLLSEALRQAEIGINLGPTEPWAQSAMSWVQLARRDYDEAMRLSVRAATLAPEDGNVLDFHGSIALFSGEFDMAAEAAQKAAQMGGSNRRFANRNIFGAASFHIGKHMRSVDAFRAAAAFGDPISAPSFFYQAAALQALGRTEEALQMLDDLTRAWPDTNVKAILTSVFANPTYVEQLTDLIEEIER